MPYQWMVATLSLRFRYGRVCASSFELRRQLLDQYFRIERLDQQAAHTSSGGTLPNVGRWEGRHENDGLGVAINALGELQPARSGHLKIADDAVDLIEHVRGKKAVGTVKSRAW